MERLSSGRGFSRYVQIHKPILVRGKRKTGAFVKDLIMPLERM